MLCLQLFNRSYEFSCKAITYLPHKCSRFPQSFFSLHTIYVKQYALWNLRLYTYIHTYKVVEMQHKMFHDSILCLCKLVSFPTHTLKIADSLRQVKSASILCRLLCTISSVKMKQGNCLLLLFVTKLSNGYSGVVIWYTLSF